MGLSKNKIKYIQSLKDKKHRIESGTFVAEGYKIVLELLACMRCQLLVSTSDFLSEVDVSEIEEVMEVTNDELARASFLKTPQKVLGVFYQPVYSEYINWDDELILALDGVQDPGNVGTIVRLADWYGIKHIFCSADTADIYNPKATQATMGAIARVNIHYVDLEEFLKEHQSIPIYGTLLDGENMYTQNITKNGIIVMGNEGNGIRPNIEKWINKKLFIPNYPVDKQSSESLNVAIATAIICAEFRRKLY